MELWELAAGMQTWRRRAPELRKRAEGTVRRGGGLEAGRRCGDMEA